MIEVTNEMIRAAQAATRCEPAVCDECIAAALAVALAIVERGMAEQAQLEWDALEYCSSTDPDHPGWHCECQAGHDGPHRAMRWQLEWS